MKHINVACIPLTRRFVILTLIIVFTIGMSGCKSTRSKMLEHLSKKYNGQEFICLSIGNAGYFGQGTTIMDCYPKGGDPKADHVWVDLISGKNYEIFSDSYFGIIIREDLEAEVLAACSDLPLPMKVYFISDSLCYDDTFDGTKTLADLKEGIINRGSGYWFSGTVFVFVDGLDKYKKENYANQIFDRIKKNSLEKDGFRMSIDVRFYPSKALEKITRTNRYNLEDVEIYHKSVN